MAIGPPSPGSPSLLRAPDKTYKCYVITLHLGENRMRQRWIPRIWWTRVGVLLLTLHAAPAVAQQSAEDMRREIDALKAEMRRIQALH